MSLWDTQQKPFFVLAPLADVTDPAFRRLIAKYSAHERTDGSVGGPDVMWTEFVSADGLIRAPEEGRARLMKHLLYTEAERPIIAQLFSSIPEHMERATALVRELGFDGVDINMGCPDRAVEKQGCGAALMKDPHRAVELIEAAKRGAGTLPVSVKTRLGYNTDELETLMPVLLRADPAALTIHARTRKEMSKVPARWERIKRAVEIRDALGSSTRIIGNGDVRDREHAAELARESGADGVMFGRAIFGNPWLFHPDENADTVPLRTRLAVMLEHTKLFEELLPERNFATMKKHYKAYVHGFTGAKELRVELMGTNSAEEVEQVVHKFMQHTQGQILDSSATLYT